MSSKLIIYKLIRASGPVLAVSQTADGQRLLVGHENGMTLFQADGTCLFSYPSGEDPIPVHQLALNPAGTRAIFVTRTGLVMDIPVPPFDRISAKNEVYAAVNDVNTLAVFFGKGQGQPSQPLQVALGHLSNHLTYVQTDRKILWEQVTQNKVWKVCFDFCGETLYVASSGLGLNQLVVLDPQTGKVKAGCYLNEGQRIATLCPLPGNAGVVVSITENNRSGWLLAYTKDLKTILWKTKLQDSATALASDPDLAFLAAGTGNDGNVLAINADSGVIEDQLALHSTVNCLAFSQARSIAAGLQNGQLVIFHFKTEEFTL